MIDRRGLLIVVLASFVVGGSVGLIGGVLFSRNVFRHSRMLIREHIRERGPRGLPPGMKDLELTPAQEDAVLREVERSREDFRAVRETLHVRITRHLTPEQRTAWERMLRSFVHRDRDRPWPGPRPPAGPGPEPDERREERR